MKLLLATRNNHKLREIKQIFSFPGLELYTPDDMPGLPEVVETGETFEANAVLKAVTLARAGGLWTMADDSGLEVDALHGAPGVRSARFAGEPPDYSANNRKLLQSLRGIRERQARFRCVIALSDPLGRARTVEGICAGRIATEPRGHNGFGYDPLFIPEGYERTFAEMSAAEKNRISHRARALAAARQAWSAIFLAGGSETDLSPSPEEGKP